MKQTRTIALAILTGLTLATSGCAIIRGQEQVGTYVDDKSIQAAIKAKMIEDKHVDAAAVHVDVLNGEVALSGYAKSAAEKEEAARIAAYTHGVRAVHNNLIVRP